MNGPIPFTRWQLASMARMYRNGASFAEVSERYGISINAVKARLLKMGVKFRRPGGPRRYTVEELALAYSMRQEGICWKRIAQGLGYDDHRALSKAINSAVHRGIKKDGNGYERKPGRRGQYDLRVLQNAVEMRAVGFKWREIAEEYGGTADAIRCAVAHALIVGLIQPSMRATA